LVVAQSLFYCVIATLMLVPFIGLFLCLLTPIAPIYLSSISILEENAPLYAIPLVFLALNVVVAYAAITLKDRRLA
jgi:hypothetical protein